MNVLVGADVKVCVGSGALVPGQVSPGEVEGDAACEGGEEYRRGIIDHAIERISEISYIVVEQTIIHRIVLFSVKENIIAGVERSVVAIRVTFSRTRWI